MAVGNVTTGDPGTQASVTNSGTEQEATLDFVIPQGPTGPTGETGPTGSAPPADFLNAYSTPPQGADSGSSLIFDRNGDSNGTSVTHALNSSDVVVQQPGFYSVSFNGAVSPVASATFPLSVLLSLEQNGTNVAGAAARSSLQSADQINNMAFSQIVNVTSAPATFTVSNTGGPILYSDAAITVSRIGDNS